MGDEKGADTWKKPQTAKTGGGGVWGAMSLDVTTNELFVPVGNPWPDIDVAYRPGDNLFDSMVILDAHRRAGNGGTRSPQGLEGRRHGGSADAVPR